VLPPLLSFQQSYGFYSDVPILSLPTFYPILTPSTTRACTSGPPPLPVPMNHRSELDPLFDFRRSRAPSDLARFVSLTVPRKPRSPRCCLQPLPLDRASPVLFCRSPTPPNPSAGSKEYPFPLVPPGAIALELVTVPRLSPFIAFLAKIRFRRP